MTSVMDAVGVGRSETLPATMKAVVCYNPGDYRLETVPVPTPGPDQVLTRVEACGICMGDVKTFRGAPSFWGDSVQPRYVKPPMIPGHEFIGRVVAVGPHGDTHHKVRLGERVISEQIVPCWDCRFCHRGQYWMCEKHDLYGFQHNVNGAMAEYMIYPREAIVHEVPDHVPIDEAILIEPLACSLHAVERAEIKPDDVVVIAGAGTLGLGMIGAVRLLNPRTVIALDTRSNRLELARRLGADLVMNPTERDVVTEVKALTAGYGCDVYIEATGYPPAVSQGLAMIRKLGTFVEFSVFTDEATVDWSIIGDRKELTIHGSHLGPYTYPRAIDYIATRKIDVRGIVTHEYPLERFADALGVMERGERSLKVVLRP